jgi:hypothetical protein
METTYRFRFLIYLAAFMLVMSVCFVYAEPVPSQPTPSHLLFQVAPQHGSFLATSADEPTFDPAALRIAAPVISPVALRLLEDASRPHRWSLRRAKRAGVRTAPAAVQSEPSVLGLPVETSSSATSAR